jgi:lysophospholipase L1-like esterase
MLPLSKTHVFKSALKFLLLLILLTDSVFDLKAQTCTKAFHIVVLGSSTAYGDGASPGNSWVALYTDYLKNINPNYIVDNLAVPGTTTYSAQPDNYVPPKGRPAPLIGHNITTAVQLKADAILINFPTNDAASDYTLTEQQNNFKRITAIAKNHGILVWVATTQPRDNFTRQQVGSQKKLFTWIENFYKGNSTDFQTGLASAKDSILFKYNAGDGIHLNDSGHQVLYQRVVAKDIPDSLCNAINKFQFSYNSKPDALPLFLNQPKPFNMFFVDNNNYISTICQTGNRQTCDSRSYLLFLPQQFSINIQQHNF